MQVQLVHEKLLVVRKQLGGHTEYAVLRSAAELREVHEADVRAAAAQAVETARAAKEAKVAAEKEEKRRRRAEIEAEGRRGGHDQVLFVKDLDTGLMVPIENVAGYEEKGESKGDDGEGYASVPQGEFGLAVTAQIDAEEAKGTDMDFDLVMKLKNVDRPAARGRDIEAHKLEIKAYNLTQKLAISATKTRLAGAARKADLDEELAEAMAMKDYERCNVLKGEMVKTANTEVLISLASVSTHSVPDDLTPRCTGNVLNLSSAFQGTPRCAATFGFFTRRHHCRLCGLVFCDACTKFKRVLPEAYAEKGAVRVCGVCIKMQPGHLKRFAPSPEKMIALRSRALVNGGTFDDVEMEEVIKAEAQRGELEWRYQT